MLMSEHHHSSVHARQMRCRQAHAYTCTMLHASVHVHNAARKLPLLASSLNPKAVPCFATRILGVLPPGSASNRCALQRCIDIDARALTQIERCICI